MRQSPAPTPAHLVNADVRCNGVRLLEERTITHLAVYRWVKSDGGGYRPERTALDGSLVTDTRLTLDQNGITVVLVLTFNPEGARLLDDLPAAASTAALGTPERRLPIFIGLTNDQIARWQDPAVQSRAMRAPDQGGNLLTDPTIVNGFTSNQLAVMGNVDLVTLCSLSAARAG